MQIVIKNILTNYEVLGKKDAKETLVILHGWQRSLVEWGGIAKFFSDKYKVVWLDLPGFGGTSFPDKDWTIYDYTDFFEEFLKKIKVSKVVFLGHSFGGRIGIISASRSKLIKKLILVDSGAIEKKSVVVRLKVVIAKILKPILYLLPRNLRRKIKNKFGSADYQSSGELRRTFVNVINEDLTPLLSKIKVPTLVIWGDKDKVLSVQQTKVFKREIKDCLVRIVWGAGHDPHLDKPEEFTMHISQFINYV